MAQYKAKKSIAIYVLAFLVLAAPLFAQTPSIPGDKLGFDQPAGTLAEAQGYGYKLYLDGATMGVGGVATCAGAASPFLCTVPLPALTTGTHTVQLTASVTLPAPDNRVIESVKSAVLSFRLFAAPGAPSTVRIVP